MIQLGRNPLADCRGFTLKCFGRLVECGAFLFALYLHMSSIILRDQIPPPLKHPVTAPKRPAGGNVLSRTSRA